MSQKPEAFSVSLNRGRFDLLDPSRVEIQVVVRIPEQKPVSFLLDEDELIDLYDLQDEIPWSELVTTACERFRKRVLWSSRTNRIQELYDWVRDPANAARLDLAWADRQLRYERARLKQIRERIEELEAFAKQRQEVVSR